MMSVFSRERLSALNATYARCIDNDQLEQWADFFPEHCLYLITNADNYADGMPGRDGYADTRAMLQDRVLAMRDANVYEEQLYRHIIGAPLVLEQDNDHAVVESPFLVARIMRGGGTEVFATGAISTGSCNCRTARSNLPSAWWFATAPTSIRCW